jgi:ariadne-1
MISLSCSHFFCLTCYVHQLTNQINNGEVIGLKCMEPSCKFHFNGDILIEILPISIYEKYTTFLTKKLITGHPNYLNCPNNDNCNNVIICPEITTLDIHNDYICECGVKFCINCKHLYHSPATCANIFEWNLLNEGNLELFICFIYIISNSYLN